MREWLLELRKKQGLSQQQVSQSANISTNFYCYIENGNRRPSVEVAKRIAAVLGFDWQKFYED